LAYDATRRVVVLYGGTRDNFSNAVWLWDGQRWSTSYPAHHPRLAQDGVLVYDPVRKVVVRPFTLADGLTRLWNGQDWLTTDEKSTALPVGDYGAAWDAARSQIVQFGGTGPTYFSDQTVIWNGSTWKVVQPAHHPPARSNDRLVYDPSSRLVLLMGQGSDGTWTWDGSDWTELHPQHTPAPFRLASAMALDPRGRILLFGGNGEDDGPQFLSDTWAWNGTDWTELHPQHHPAGRAYSTMAFDEARQQDVLFSGDEADGTLPDTWVWNGDDWRREG
jgi:hypothetical protein